MHIIRHTSHTSNSISHIIRNIQIVLYCITYYKTHIITYITITDGVLHAFRSNENQHNPTSYKHNEQSNIDVSALCGMKCNPCSDTISRDMLKYLMPYRRVVTNR